MVVWETKIKNHSLFYSSKKKALTSLSEYTLGRYTGNGTPIFDKENNVVGRLHRQEVI